MGSPKTMDLQLLAFSWTLHTDVNPIYGDILSRSGLPGRNAFLNWTAIDEQ